MKIHHYSVVSYGCNLYRELQYYDEVLAQRYAFVKLDDIQAGNTTV